MLTGRIPFNVDLDGNTDSDFLIKRAHVDEPPMELSDLRPYISVWVSDAVKKALKKDPNERHRSCGEFLRALDGGEATTVVNSSEIILEAPPSDPLPPFHKGQQSGDNGETLIQPAKLKKQGESKNRKIIYGAVAICAFVGVGYWVGSGSDGADFARIPAGSFIMGSPSGELGRFDDETQHHVSISRPFMMQVTEVTQGQWQDLMGYNPAHFKGCGANCPVEQVNWHEALAYANATSATEGVAQCFDCTGSGTSVECDLKPQYTKPQDCPGYRLPTEAEWEYAARAGTTTAFHTGRITGTTTCSNMDAAGWYDSNSGSTTHAVGGKAANAWGLYDMHGNMWEWTWDWYQENFGSTAVTDPAGPSYGSNRVLRGGSWRNSARYCRAASRYDNDPGSRYIFIGFRLVRSI